LPVLHHGSEFNRNYILNHYPIARDKIAVHRIGVDLNSRCPSHAVQSSIFTLLSVGRLHPIKNHSFLLLACHSLKTAGVPFRCLLAGDGPEREKLARLISELGLEWEVSLLGQVPPAELSHLYAQADAVVLTSHSEGIPVTLMEAMAMERLVLAPAITGIPELVTHGKTGLLYKPGSLDDFLTKVNAIAAPGRNFNPFGMRPGARLRATMTAVATLPPSLRIFSIASPEFTTHNSKKLERTRMRILYCNKYNFGFSGTEAYLFETMELMRARGHEVALFSMADPRGRATAYDHNFVAYADFKRQGTVTTKTRLALHAIYSIEARNKIRNMIADFRPDVAHVRNIYHHLSPSIL
jgi:hypothetical protein